MFRAFCDSSDDGRGLQNLMFPLGNQYFAHEVDEEPKILSTSEKGQFDFFKDFKGGNGVSITNQNDYRYSDICLHLIESCELLEEDKLTTFAMTDRVWIGANNQLIASPNALNEKYEYTVSIKCSSAYQTIISEPFTVKKQNS